MTKFISIFCVTIMLICGCTKSDSEFEWLYSNWKLNYLETVQDNGINTQKTNVTIENCEFSKDGSLILTPEFDNHIIRYWTLIEGNTRMLIVGNAIQLLSQEEYFYSRVYNILHFEPDSISIERSFVDDGSTTTIQWNFTK